jgi:hypothetical protein
MRSRYDVIKPSEQKNIKGQEYPDILTFPMTSFVFNDPVEKVEITQVYKERFYLTCYERYGVTYYDDIILWINGIDSVYTMEVGDIIYFPSKKDIERFLAKYRVKN